MTSPPPVSVREAREVDLDAVGRLLHDFNREFDDPAPEPAQLAVRVRELLAGGHTGLVVAGDAPVGLALMRFRLSLCGPVNFYYERELQRRLRTSRRPGVARAIWTFRAPPEATTSTWPLAPGGRFRCGVRGQAGWGMSTYLVISIELMQYEREPNLEDPR